MNYSDTIRIHKLDESYLFLETGDRICKELHMFFSFDVPNRQFIPEFKNKEWDGQIHLFNRLTRQIYSGLFEQVVKFAQDRGYYVEFDEKLFAHKGATTQQAEKFYQKFGLDFEPHDFQVEGLKIAFNKRKCLLISATSSGKSLIVYAITRAFCEKTRCLILVPNVSLVTQMQNDFVDYAANDTYNVDTNMHTIYEGQAKDVLKPITISTWQSLYKLPQDYFERYGCVIVDEVHQAKANCLRSIMEKCVNAKVRVGVTGTLDGTLTHEMVLTGLFGPIHTLSTARELMDRKLVANLNITALVLKYEESLAKEIRGAKYRSEIDFIIKNPERNQAIAKLAVSRKRNTLVLFRLIEHGKILYNMIQALLLESERKVFYVAGETEKDVREQVRQIVEKERDAIIVASEGVFSTGINIRNLDDLIFASPSKARIRTIQSIGRILRKGDYGNDARVYDIVDDLSYKRHENFALKHFRERVRIYDTEKYDYRILHIKGKIGEGIQERAESSDSLPKVGNG